MNTIYLGRFRANIEKCSCVSQDVTLQRVLAESHFHSGGMNGAGGVVVSPLSLSLILRLSKVGSLSDFQVLQRLFAYSYKEEKSALFLLRLYCILFIFFFFNLPMDDLATSYHGS